MDYTKSLQMNIQNIPNIPNMPNIPMNIDKGRMHEIEHIKSAVTLLVHFKYVLFYVKEHYFIDIDYKIDTLSPQLKSDVDRCLQLYNELLQSSKYLNFIHNRENNYQSKSPIYNTFKTDRLEFQHSDPAHDLNIELQNLYQTPYVGDGGVGVGGVVQRNLNVQFEQQAQLDQNFRPLNDYNEYFQTINQQLAPTNVATFQTNNDRTQLFVQNQHMQNQMASTSAAVAAASASITVPIHHPLPTTTIKAVKPKRQAAPRPKKEKKPPKKRKRAPEEWKRNKAKTMRNAGLEYISIKKKVIPAKKLQPTCEKCIQKCNTKIKEDDRKEIFDQYWAIPNINMKRNYIASCITQIKPKYRYPKGDSNRKLNNAFHFKLNGSSIRVCKRFFLNTLDINNRTIQTVIRKCKSTGIVEEDKRGRRKRRPPTTEVEPASQSTESQAQTAKKTSSELEPPSSELSQSSQQLQQQTSELSQSSQLPQTSSGMIQSPDLSQAAASIDNQTIVQSNVNNQTIQS